MILRVVAVVGAQLIARSGAEFFGSAPNTPAIIRSMVTEANTISFNRCNAGRFTDPKLDFRQLLCGVRKPLLQAFQKRAYASGVAQLDSASTVRELVQG